MDPPPPLYLIHSGAFRWCLFWTQPRAETRLDMIIRLDTKRVMFILLVVVVCCATLIRLSSKYQALAGSYSVQRYYV